MAESGKGAPSFAVEVERWNGRCRLLAACVNVESEDKRSNLDDDLSELVAPTQRELRLAALDEIAADLASDSAYATGGVDLRVACVRTLDLATLEEAGRASFDWGNILSRHPWLAAFRVGGEWGRAIVRETFTARFLSQRVPDGAPAPEVEGWVLPPEGRRDWLTKGIVSILRAADGRSRKAASAAFQRLLFRELPARRGIVTKHALELLARAIVLRESFPALTDHLQRIAPKESDWSWQAVQKVLRPEADRLGVDLSALHE